MFIPVSSPSQVGIVSFWERAEEVRSAWVSGIGLSLVFVMYGRDETVAKSDRGEGLEVAHT